MTAFAEGIDSAAARAARNKRRRETRPREWVIKSLVSATSHREWFHDDGKIRDLIADERRA